MIKHKRSNVWFEERGVHSEQDIMPAHPIALDNAFVLLVLAVDLATHHAEELKTLSPEIEDFMSSYTQPGSGVK
jgi:hypothetical protein